MKNFWFCIFYFSFFFFRLKANVLSLLITEPFLSKEVENKIYKANAINSPLMNQEFKFSLLALFLLGVILILARRNLQLKKNEIQTNTFLLQREKHYNAMIEAEGRERLHMVRVLHDNIGQQLSAAKLNISALQSFSKNINPADKITVQKAVDLLDNSIKDIRNAAHAIIPNTLIKSGFVSALVELVNNNNSSGNTKINLDLVGNISRFSQSSEVVLYRILRELINNSLKHAKASEINVQLITHENELNIIVQDNGVGYEIQPAVYFESTAGLNCVHAQVAFLKGKVFFDSQPGKGTTVSIELPMSIN